MANSLQDKMTVIGDPDPAALAFSDIIISPEETTVPTPHADTSAYREPTERDRLLPARTTNEDEQGKPIRSSFWKAGRRWLVPFWLLASFSRGMTLAPRVEVYTNLACEAYLHDQPQHTVHPAAPNSTNVDIHHTPYSQSSSYSSYPETTLSSPLLLPDVLPPLFFPEKTANITRARVRRLRSSKHPISDGEDPTISEPRKRCVADPNVQKHAAQLQMAVILTMGSLSAMTTGWWGSVGDRIGRRKVMALALFGYLFTDVMFLVVALYAKSLAPWGGHKLLILGPIVEGLLGGWATAASAVNAYVADITPHGSRAHVFSSFFGIQFVGVALGPAFSSLILRFSNEILLVFLVSVSLSLINCFYAAFVVPESLTKESRAASRLEHLTTTGDTEAAGDEEVTFAITMRARIATLFSALRLLAPRGKDWKLMYLGIAYFAIYLTAGLYPLKLMYAEHLFGWTSIELGNFLTLAGSVRSIHLLFILPLLVKIFKPKHEPPPPPPGSLTPAFQVETGPILVPTSPILVPKSPAASSISSLSHAQTIILKDMQFDIALARISLFIDALGYFFIATTTSPQAFVLSTVLSAFGGGAAPAIQSICMCLLTNPKEDAGKMFGALSMLMAVSSTIVSPLVFGLLYSATVEAFPAAIFVCGAALLFISLVVLLLVRPKRTKKKNARGRSTRRKRLSGSVTGTRETSLISERPDSV